MEIEKIKNLIQILNKASHDYYNGSPSMSDHEYDKLYDELVDLEKKTGVVFSNSPTQNVGYEASKELVKEKHSKPMLSLDKTKDREVLKDFLLDKEVILSYTMDGLTIFLPSENGKLVKGITRGNGEVGEVVTNNVLSFENVPHTISFKGNLIIRGEAIISYSDFKKINEEIIDKEEKYKNPRNLCSGAVRQLDPKITKERHVKLYAFSLVEINGENAPNFKTFKEQLDYLKNLGFDIVLYKEVNKNNILDVIEWFSEDVKKEDYPSDGLVLIFNDLKYGESLGRTAKFPRNALAFKWKDELAETILREIEWSPSRTGLINPVAIFDPVDLEGTVVKRASIHNISIMKELCLGIGDKITVFKANMIIPQIAENLTKSNKIDIPKKCPVCNTETVINNENGVETLICPNKDCPVKNIKSFELFVSRNAFNIEGISIQTLDTFIEHGFIKTYADIFKLKKYKKEIVELEGFGEKSFENIINAIEIKRAINLENFINSLGINGIGLATSKLLSKHFDNNIQNIFNASKEELSTINEIGPVLANNIYEYFHDNKKLKIIDDLLKEVSINKIENKTNLKLQNKIFVITGSLNHFTNRDELVKVIEDNGGKASSSISKNTSYLINNDINSSSSKNKNAKKLNVPIISEEEFINLIK